MAISKKTGGHTDFNKQQLLNAVFDKSSDRNTPPVEGMVRWNTTTHKQENYNGTAWIALPTESNEILPANVVFVSGSYTITDSKHFTNIQSAIDSFVGNYGLVIVYQGIYASNIIINSNITVMCEGDVTLSCRVVMSEYSKLLGFFSVESADGGYILSGSNCVIEGNYIPKLITSGSCDIRTYNLGFLIVTNSTATDMQLITAYTHTLGTVITTPITADLLDNYTLYPNENVNGSYCVCSLDGHGIPYCNYAKKCLMFPDWDATGLGADTARNTRVVINTNVRSNSAQTFAGLGKLIINFLHADNFGANLTSRHYATNPNTLFRYTGGDETHFCQTAIYNVANEAILQLDNLRSHNTGDHIVMALSYSKVSINNCSLESNSAIANSVAANPSPILAFRNNIYSPASSNNYSVVVSNGNSNTSPMGWI